MLLLCLGLLISVTGCRTTTINVIDKEDFFAMEEGQSYVAPRAGWFSSNEIMEDIWKAGIKT